MASGDSPIEQCQNICIITESLDVGSGEKKALSSYEDMEALIPPD